MADLFYAQNERYPENILAADVIEQSSLKCTSNSTILMRI